MTNDALFVGKKDYPVGMASSYLPKATRNNYRSVTAYLPKSDWNLVARISRNTWKHKVDFVRKAVDEYLRKSW